MPCDIKSWGPATWTLLHCAALTYGDDPPSAKRKAMFNFLEAIGAVLPCPRCGQHWRKGMQFTEMASPTSTHLDSADKLFEWTVQMHNRVNASRGKKELEIDEALRTTLSRPRKASLHEQAQSTSKQVFTVGFVSLLVLCALLYLILRCRSAERVARQLLQGAPTCRSVS